MDTELYAAIWQNVCDDFCPRYYGMYADTATHQLSISFLA